MTRENSIQKHMEPYLSMNLTKNPFFIIGNPRSGTTLLRLILNKHPKAIVPPECGFSLWLYNKFKYKEFSDNHVRIEFIKDLYNTRKFETWNIKKKLVESLILQHGVKSFTEAIKMVYLAYAMTNNRKSEIYGDKNNYFIDHIPELNKIFNKPKFIFIIRDGRDVALSYININKSNITTKYRPKLPSEIQQIACEWQNNNLSILETKNLNSILVKYENLILDTTTTLNNICNFLDIKYDKQMLKFYESNDEPLEFMQWKSKTNKPIDKSRVGAYKKLLSHKDIAMFESTAGATLRKLGYLN